MVLAAPEFVIAERIELLDQVEVPAELQHRMLADRVMRGEESSEFEARYLFLSGGLLLLLVCGASYVLNGSRAIAEGPRGRRSMAPCAQPMDRLGCQAVGGHRRVREPRGRRRLAQQPRHDEAQWNRTPRIGQQRHQFLARAAVSPGTRGEQTDLPQDVAPAVALSRGIQQSHQP